jgi:hypothetical protein
MPDSLLPIQGPASQRERDLDALLSDTAGYPVVVLGPVADALAALRAAPAPDELDGEAAARAAFRLFMLPAAGMAGGAPVPDPLREVPAPLHEAAAAGQGYPDGQGATVVLPMTVPGGPRHARPRSRLPRPGRWQAAAVACGAAAAVIVFVAGLAGAFSGPGGQQAGPGHQPSVQASGTSSKHPTSSVLGTATAHPVPRPSTVNPEALCRQYMEFFTRPESSSDWSAEKARGEQLSSLAGGRMRIMGYCARHSGTGASGGSQGYQGGAGGPGSGSQPGRGGHGEPVIPRLGRARSALPQAGTRPSPAGPVRTGRTAR